MLRKGWEAIALLGVFVIAANMIAVAIQPFLPFLGAVVILLISGGLIRFFVMKRKFW